MRREVCRPLAWVLLLALLVAQVWALYLLVPSGGDPLVPGQDKVGHAILFGAPFGLALLLGARAVALGILAHAVLSEPLQALLTSARTPDGWDTAADLTGIALATVVVWMVTDRVAARRSDPVVISR